ncbi:MAG: YggS family pyridoxal phosphate-dependent enzyme [Solirubrobacteraceae bacterium]
MVELIQDLDAETVRANLELVRAQIAAAARGAGRDPAEVELLAAVKYVPVEELGVLAQAGIELVGENRAQELERKAAALPGAFTWDFIGHLQSRKVKQILPHVRLIHSVASDTVLAQLERHADPSTRVLVEVNIAREPGKSGIDPDQVAAFIDRCPVEVVGLMTMPPLAPSPEDSRPHFAALAELARGLGLPQLSMGTSQDYRVAVEEGATIVRLGTILYSPTRHNPGRETSRSREPRDPDGIPRYMAPHPGLLRPGRGPRL